MLKKDRFFQKLLLIKWDALPQGTITRLEDAVEGGLVEVLNTNTKQRKALILFSHIMPWSRDTTFGVVGSPRCLHHVTLSLKPETLPESWSYPPEPWHWTSPPYFLLPCIYSSPSYVLMGIFFPPVSVSPPRSYFVLLTTAFKTNRINLLILCWNVTLIFGTQDLCPLLSHSKCRLHTKQVCKKLTAALYRQVINKSDALPVWTGGNEFLDGLLLWILIEAPLPSMVLCIEPVQQLHSKSLSGKKNPKTKQRTQD